MKECPYANYWNAREAEKTAGHVDKRTNEVLLDVANTMLDHIESSSKCVSIVVNI
jgi:hypothetical protein